ncbi:hypothetical protein CK203_026485 [Vitis vinifera]|uniref:Retrotransposon gag domain-containing protein n=1 Tax=Vitis vinifera TaxID=29760 RepID=A0A438IVI9_VITVI|nr:hypothetical protein CK203_026485 [Vitis vinifera]
MVSRLPPNSVDNFRDLSEAFVGQYLCSARHKQNINTLQNIKMQDNESLREFMKRFGQAVLQVEAYSIDAVLQIFKRNICPGTPFFESLSKKPLTTMDDLFRRANKYSMLEDDVRATTQQVLVADRHPEVARKEVPNFRTGQGRPIEGKKGQVARKAAPHTLSISYEKLLPTIQACPTSGGLDPSERTHPKEIIAKNMSSTRNMVTQQRHADVGGRDASQNHNSGAPRAPTAPKAVINYINGDPSNEEYDSKRKRQKLLRAASVRECVNSIQPGIMEGASLHRWDNRFPTSRPHPDTTPYHDALILSLEIGDFDVRRIWLTWAARPILYKHRSLATWNTVSQASRTLGESCPDSTGRQLFLGRHCAAGPSWPSHFNVQFSDGTRFITLQCHLGAHMATLHESHPLYISSNGKFPYQGWAN